MPKYVLKETRYLHGKTVFASPEYPALVELTEGEVSEKDLKRGNIVLYVGPESAAPEKLVKPFVEKDRGGAPTAGDFYGARPDAVPPTPVEVELPPKPEPPKRFSRR